MMVSLGGTGGQNTVSGCLCLLGAYFCGAFYTILVRRLSKVFSAFELTYVMFTVGVVFFAGLAFATYRTDTLPMITGALIHWEFIAACLFLGGVASVGAYMLVNYSLSRLTVTRSAIFSCFATLISVLSGVLIMKDSFTPVSAVAFVLILLGVWGVNRFAAPAAEPVEK